MAFRRTGNVINIFVKIFIIIWFTGIGAFFFAMSAFLETKGAEFIGVYDFTLVSAFTETERSDPDEDGVVSERTVYKYKYVTADGKYVSAEKVSADDYRKFFDDETFRPTVKRSVWQVGKKYECFKEDATEKDVLFYPRIIKAALIIAGIGMIIAGFFIALKKKRGG